jgi:hypothetical protein
MDSSSTTVPPEIRRPDLRHAIIRALQTSYDVSQERHDPGVGDTALTFGIHTWASSTFYLVRELTGLTDLACTVANQSLEARVGRCRLRALKLGGSEADNPWHSFPDHVGPASRMGRAVQLELQLGLESIEPLDWIIAHYGNPDEGLRAVRLQAVGSERSEDGRITRWRAIETIYEAGAVSLTVLAGAQPDVVAIAEAELTLRQPTQEDTQHRLPS